MSPPYIAGLLAVVATALSFAADDLRAAEPSPTVDVAAADNAFGFRLLNAVQKTIPDGNVVISPLSAAVNLSMLLNGAAGQTRDEIAAALSLSGWELDAINTANADLVGSMRTPDAGITLSLADSLWVDNQRAKLRPDYMKRMQNSYDAEVANLNFSAPIAPRRINSWVARETHGKIPKIIDRIERSDLAFLLNAVYFKGRWTHPFDEANTRQHEFTLDSGLIRQVARMSQSGRFDYFETPAMQAIRLPFGDGNFVMHVFLPNRSSSLRAFEAQLTPEHWRAWQARYASRSGTFELPRFELRSSYRLNEPLQSLGIRRAFEPSSAQLPAMLSTVPGQAGTARSSIFSVRQSAYWKVDEEGSEAAAVTSTEVRTAAVTHQLQPFRMIVDRPFFCAIQNQRSGALLFVGAIHDPGPLITK